MPSSFAILSAVLILGLVGSPSLCRADRIEFDLTGSQFVLTQTDIDTGDVISTLQRTAVGGALILFTGPDALATAASQASIDGVTLDFGTLDGDPVRIFDFGRLEQLIFNEPRTRLRLSASSFQTFKLSLGGRVTPFTPTGGVRFAMVGMTASGRRTFQDTINALSYASRASSITLQIVGREVARPVPEPAASWGLPLLAAVFLATRIRSRRAARLAEAASSSAPRRRLGC